MRWPDASRHKIHDERPELIVDHRGADEYRLCVDRLLKERTVVSIANNDACPSSVKAGLRAAYGAAGTQGQPAFFARPSSQIVTVSSDAAFGVAGSWCLADGTQHTRLFASALLLVQLHRS